MQTATANKFCQHSIKKIKYVYSDVQSSSVNREIFNHKNLVNWGGRKCPRLSISGRENVRGNCPGENMSRGEFPAPVAVQMYVVCYKPCFCEQFGFSQYSVCSELHFVFMGKQRVTPSTSDTMHLHQYHDRPTPQKYHPLHCKQLALIGSRHKLHNQLEHRRRKLFDNNVCV